MKKLNIFWKVILIVLFLSTTGLFGFLAWHQCDRLYGRNGYTENFSRGLEKVFYRSGTVRIINTQTMRYTTPKLDWIANYDEMDSLTVFCYQCKRGYMSLYDGKITIPAQYQAAWMFSEGLGAVIKDNKLGFINTQGKEAIPFKFPINPVSGVRIDYLFKKGVCTMINRNGKQGLINKHGEWVLEPKYDYIRNPENGFRLLKKSGKFGLLDSLMTLILPVEFDTIAIQKDGFIVVKDAGQYKLASDAKTIVTPFTYDETEDLYYNSGKVNIEGEDIMLKSDYITYRIQDKWGLLDKNGKVVLKAKYNSINSLDKDLFSCQIDDNWITVDAKGNIIY